MNLDGVSAAGLKVVADCAGGTVSLVLPTLLGGLGVDVHTLNNRLDEVTPTQTVAQDRAGMQRLAEVVSSSRAAFGVRFDPVGERIHLVDEKGALVSDERALLVVLDLVAAELRHGRVALPVTTTRVAEQVCRFHGVQVTWTPTSRDALTTAAAADDVIFAADGRGGFVVPEFGRTVDGIAAFVRLLGLVAQDAADPQPDRRPHPAGAPDAALGAHPVGGQGVGDADRHGGGGHPAGRHHRRRADRRRGAGLGARAARPGGRGHPPVGGGRRRRLGPAAARRVGAVVEQAGE